MQERKLLQRDVGGCVTTIVGVAICFTAKSQRVVPSDQGPAANSPFVGLFLFETWALPTLPGRGWGSTKVSSS